MSGSCMGGSCSSTGCSMRLGDMPRGKEGSGSGNTNRGLHGV